MLLGGKECNWVTGTSVEITIRREDKAGAFTNGNVFFLIFCACILVDKEYYSCGSSKICREMSHVHHLSGTHTHECLSNATNLFF